MPKILVAEDSFALANLLDFALKNAGFEVNVCRSGSKALAELLAHRYDVILLDQQMPKMTGVEVVEQFRQSGPNLGTPAFLCTAKAHELDLEYIKGSLKVIEVFHKPFSPRDLVQTLLETSLAAESR